MAAAHKEMGQFCVFGGCVWLGSTPKWHLLLSQGLSVAHKTVWFFCISIIHLMKEPIFNEADMKCVFP